MDVLHPHRCSNQSARILAVMETMAAATWPIGGRSAEPSSAPSAPGDLVGTVGSASHVDLAWTDTSENEDGFAVQWKDVAAGAESPWIDIATDLPRNTSRFQSVGLEAEHTYVHRVRAFNRHGPSGWVELGPLRTRKAPSTHRGRVLVAPSEVSPLTSEGSESVESSFLKLNNGHLLLLHGLRVLISEDDRNKTRARIMRLVSKDNGRTWQDGGVLVEHPQFSIFLPSLVRMANGQIGLAYSRFSRLSGVLTTKKVFCHSNDEGKSWSDERVISTGDYAYSTGSHDRFVRLADGRLLITVHAKRGRGDLGTYVLYSDDNGRTWTRTPKDDLLYVPGNPNKSPEHGFWEASIVECAGGRLLMYGRTVTGWFYECRSNDRGQTWTRPKRSTVRAPIAPPVLKNVPGSDAILLIWNSCPSGRRILASQISYDEGRTWRNYRQIEYAGESYSYPCCIWVGDTLHVAFRASGPSYVRYLKLSKNELLGTTEKTDQARE